MKMMLFFALLMTPWLEARNECIVKTEKELRQVLGALQANTTIKIAAGDYGSGYTVQNVDGLVVEALDSKTPPRFAGGNEAWHFSRCNHLEVKHLHLSGQKHNGINIDDGGDRAHAVKNIRLSHLLVEDVGPQGNFDAMKFSGIDGLRIEHCRIHGWGGQAIDFVGCHRALIQHCQIEGKAGYSCTSGIQLKGGSSEVTVEQCELINAGPRPMNIGGSTGLEFFRPIDAKYEAKDITVKNNMISGGECACAFVGVDTCLFTENQIKSPKKWIFRILQETVEPGFAACRNVTISQNKISFERSDIGTEINIGTQTEPQTFRFLENRWWAKNQPLKSQPNLPTQEVGGVYGVAF